MVYTAQGVNFDGTNDYLSRGADLTGNADSKLWSGSFWWRRAATGFSWVYHGNGGAAGAQTWHILFNVSEQVAFSAENAAGAGILSITTSAIADTTNWHHVMWSFDLANASNRHVYVDGVSDITVATYTDDTMNFTETNHFIGARTDAAQKYNGDLADFWVAPGQYIDLSQAANRLKFYGPTGGAVDLGSDGATPTATAPRVYFSGATVDWHTNKGTGGGFTENGALTDAATNPPVEPDVGNPWYYYLNMELSRQ